MPVLATEDRAIQKIRKYQFQEFSPLGVKV